MKTADDTNHVSDLSIDLALQGELPDGEMAAVRAHVGACDACRERYEATAGDRAHFQREILPRTLERVARRLGATPAPAERARRRRPKALVASALAFAAVGAVILVLARRHDPVTEAAAGDVMRKGGPALKIFARHGDRVFAVADGARLKPGDTLRFVAEPAGTRYLMVASIDGANHASVYVPYGGQTSVETDGERPYQDDAAIELDATPGPERIFALFSKRPLGADEVTSALARLGSHGMAAIRAGENLDLAGVSETSLCIEK